MITEAEMDRIAKEQKKALHHLMRALEEYHKDILHNVREMERLADIIEEMARGAK